VVCFRLSDTAYSDCKGAGYSNVYLWTAGRVDHDDPTKDRYWWRPVGEAQRRMEFTFWRERQPDNHIKGRPENCVNIWPRLNYEWNDEACHHDYCFICEYQ